MKFNSNAGELASLVGQNSFDVFQHSVDTRGQLKISLQSLIDKKANSFFLYKKVVIERKENNFKILYQPLFGLNNKVTEFICIALDITEEVLD